MTTFETWWASKYGHHIAFFEDAWPGIVRAAWDAATERAAVELERRAALYQLPDGEPGSLGYNCWGWRDIARHLRETAAAIRGGQP